MGALLLSTLRWRRLLEPDLLQLAATRLHRILFSIVTIPCGECGDWGPVPLWLSKSRVSKQHSNFLVSLVYRYILYLVEFRVLNSVRDKDLDLGISCACVISDEHPICWMFSPCGGYLHPHRNMYPCGERQGIWQSWNPETLYRKEIIPVISSIWYHRWRDRARIVSPTRIFVTAIHVVSTHASIISCFWHVHICTLNRRSPLREPCLDRQRHRRSSEPDYGKLKWTIKK